SDGRYALATVGLRRIHVVDWLADDPYPQARTTPFPDASPAPGDNDARELVVDAMSSVADLARQLEPRVPEPPTLDPDPARASWEAAAVAPIGPLDAQRVLEAASAGERLSLLATMLAERAEELRARLG